MNPALLEEKAAAAPAPPPAPPPARTRSGVYWLLVAIVVLGGIFLRIYPTATFRGVGFDEALYRAYVLGMDEVGLLDYPALADAYIADQQRSEAMAKLPPTRFLYIFTSWLWKRAEFGDAAPPDLKQPENLSRDPALASLHRVASLFSIGLLFLSGLAAGRIFGRAAGLGVLALMSCAPLAVHMSQHAMVDGFFAFWAMLSLWALWENLRRPDHPGWLTLLGAGLAAMVMTKENAFFVYVALSGIVLTNRWTQLGTVTSRLLLVGVLGPLAGVVVLVFVAGGLPTLVDVYRLLVAKAHNLDYAIQTGDGPWHRYLVDLMVLSPLTLCLAIAATFTIARTHRGYVYLLGFVALSYLVMCNVRYGMNLRYATIWDLPLRALAFGQLAWMARSPSLGLSERGQRWALAAAVAALCAYDLRQYFIFFVDNRLYELASEGLLRAVKILK